MKKILFILIALSFALTSCSNRNTRSNEWKFHRDYIQSQDTPSLWSIKKIDRNVTGHLTAETYRGNYYILAKDLNPEKKVGKDYKYILVRGTKIYEDVFTFHSSHKSIQGVFEYLLKKYDELYVKSRPFQY